MQRGNMNVKDTSVIVLNLAACFTPSFSIQMLVDLFRLLNSSVGIPQWQRQMPSFVAVTGTDNRCTKL
jgi:hypothetical protein